MKTTKPIDTLRAAIMTDKLNRARKLREIDRTAGIVAAIKYLIKKGVLTNRPG